MLGRITCSITPNARLVTTPRNHSFENLRQGADAMGASRTATAYAMVSLVRCRELKTRIALAAFIGFMAWFVVPSIWPPLWFAAVLATQALDWAVFRRFRHQQDW